MATVGSIDEKSDSKVWTARRHHFALTVYVQLISRMRKREACRNARSRSWVDYEL